MQFNRPLKLGVLILVLGSGPLLLYVLFGPKDGNPIGLGLLFFFSFPAAVACMALGGVQKLLDRRQAAAHSAGALPRKPMARDFRDHPDNWG